MPGFTHLAVRTSYSLRDGVIRPRELAVAAYERGMDTIGVADRDGLYGAVRVAEACNVVGVRPIFGADLALAHDASRPGWSAFRPASGDEGPATSPPGDAALARSPLRTGSRAPTPPFARPFKGPGSGAAWLTDDAARVTLIARTRFGYANLCRLISDHHLESERGSPHVTWQQLGRRVGEGGGRVGHGLFVLLGNDSPVARLLDAGRPEAAEAEARRWMELVGPSSVLVGVTHHLAPGDDGRARARFGLADRLGLRAVAHQAPRYLTPADARIADVMDAVRQQVPLDPRHVRRRNAEGYLKTAAEMGRVFAERPDALANAAAVADVCRVDLGLGQLHVPDFVAMGEQATAELRARCEAGLTERYADVGDRHRDLLDRELAMVAELGLAPYFLTVAEIMGLIRSKQIMAACRGSAAGSVITYALRISDVDPVAHNLVFERFMNPYRDELPDIDIDVESARREDIYRELLERYGEDRVACVAMIDTFKARMAIREVGKALGMPANEIDYIAKSFPHVRAGDVRSALAHLPEMRGLNLDRSDLALLFDVVERLDGFPRHIALHPCGVLLCDATMRDNVPLERSANGFAMAQFDKDDVEALGLCKLDILAVRMLSSMTHCVEEVRRTRGEDVDFERVAWDDADTYELIRSTRTLGMFQIESPGQRELVGKFQPEHLSDLVVDISLFRPGPVKGDMVGPFLQRRLGHSKTVYPHPLLEEALGETFGVIVYHEQVMRSVAALTGCDLATADLVRRRLGDPEELDDLHGWLIAGALERGVPEAVAESLWHALSQFASFGFCKAHAAAFSVPTYRSAWLKAHYLPEFVAGLLTHDPGMYPRRLLLDDARQFGVAVLPLDVNRSAKDYRVERLPADEAWALLGVTAATRAPGNAALARSPLRTGSRRPAADTSMPRGWRWDAERQTPVPASGFDKGGVPGDPEWRFGVRLALQGVAGIDDRMIESLLLARPFTSVDDLRRRGALSAPVAEALTHAGALDEVGGVLAGVRTRRDLLLEVSERWSGLRRHQPTDPAAPEQLELLGLQASPGLAEYGLSEKVRAELEVLGIDASTHVIRFYDGLLDTLGVTRAADLLSYRNGQRVRVAGVKVATQTPPVKSGQRIIFLSLDDATGVSDATFFESVHDRCAWTVFHSWLLVVEGTVHRTGRRGVSLNAELVWDLRRLMHAWREGRLDEALAAQGPQGRQAARDFSDQSPSGIHGASGRSGLRLPPSHPARPPHETQQRPWQQRDQEVEDTDPPRKLWHSSSGSAGG
ncbi:MAG: DNA polymerase III subunit alpha [Actinomycetota bacterium]|nr:DNA polymerase III subunit alpha [Actinomycetota bacterium]